MAHILIIDDSPTEQAGMSQMLHKHGHICSFANTGEIGVAGSFFRFKRLRRSKQQTQHTTKG